MALSKVKRSKEKARLNARIADWERIGNPESEKKRKSGLSSFTKPGSNRK